MFSPALLTTLFVGFAAVHAQPNPSEPGPNEVFNEGSTCHIAWDPDTTGTWKSMYIELMTGNNFKMIHLTTVASAIDGTNPANATFDYPCPPVTPNSDIYFYQFTCPSCPDAEPLWTTRFTIADQNGHFTPPPNTTQPDGTQIGWGNGALVDPSQAVPPPPGGSSIPSGSTVVIPPPTGSGTPATSALANTLPVSVQSNAPGASGASFPGSAVPSAPVTKVSPSSGGSGASSNTGSSDGTTPTGESSTNGAVSALTMDSRVTQTIGTLAMVALAYAVAL